METWAKGFSTISDKEGKKSLRGASGEWEGGSSRFKNEAVLLAEFWDVIGFELDEVGAGTSSISEYSPELKEDSSEDEDDVSLIPKRPELDFTLDLSDDGEELQGTTRGLMGEVE